MMSDSMQKTLYAIDDQANDMRYKFIIDWFIVYDTNDRSAHGRIHCVTELQIDIRKIVCFDDSIAFIKNH